MSADCIDVFFSVVFPTRLLPTTYMHKKACLAEEREAREKKSPQETCRCSDVSYYMPKGDSDGKGVREWLRYRDASASNKHGPSSGH